MITHMNLYMIICMIIYMITYMMCTHERASVRAGELACVCVRERAQMQRPGFVDTVYLIDEELRFRREKKKREKDEYEINLVNQRIRALGMMHNRRKLAHEEKCASEKDAAVGQVIGDIYRFAFSLARFTG